MFSERNLFSGWLLNRDLMTNKSSVMYYEISTLFLGPFFWVYLEDDASFTRAGEDCGLDHEGVTGWHIENWRLYSAVACLVPCHLECLCVVGPSITHCTKHSHIVNICWVITVTRWFCRGRRRRRRKWNGGCLMVVVMVSVLVLHVIVPSRVSGNEEEYENNARQNSRNCNAWHCHCNLV